MLQKTIEKYTNILNGVKDSGMSIAAYCDREGINVRTLYHTMQNIRKNFEQETEAVQNLFYLYKECTGQTIVAEDIVEVEEIEDETPDKLTIVRDQSNKILSYKFDIPVRDSHHFVGSLSREEVESLYGLYTYYGGNLTARNVANEMPRFTLQEVRRLLRTFKCTKDSAWFPQHLLEEMSEEELNQYRMNLKERGAVKYADAQQERSWNALLKKVVAENNKLKQQLEDKSDVVSYIRDGHFELPQIDINKYKKNSDIIIFLSDMHIGAYNEKHGYVWLEEYNEQEITRRLNKIIEFLSIGEYSNIIICNLGDSVDSYNKQTTRGGHDLPTTISNKEQSALYIKIMLEFFNKLLAISPEISYICTGESNHDGDWGWINNVLLAEKLKSLGVRTYVSEQPIDSFDVNDSSIIYLHGKDIKNQFKGFPLVLNERTENWFTSYLLDSGKQFKSKRYVVKGDLHQYAVTCSKHFDYISAPSMYGSSNYIVANFGKTRWGVLYMEIDQFNNNRTGIIKD